MSKLSHEELMGLFSFGDDLPGEIPESIIYKVIYY